MTKLLLGDCLEQLRTMPDNSVDSIVTDPPYGLGKEPDALKMLTDWIETGHHDVKGRGFMGKEWDAFVPQPQVWHECLRVLKPGGHLLAFAGTRTQDLMTLGLRLAGFEIRDMVAWVYGSGFPKSLNVGMAIDKRGGNSHLTAEIGTALKAARKARGIGVTEADRTYCGGVTLWSWYEGRPAGQQMPTAAIMAAIATDWPELQRYAEAIAEAEREVVGKHTTDMGGLGGERLGQAGGDITAPATEAAKQWEGFGTALKPSLEPITLARKPLEGTVAANVLKWHTGGLNIDGCRVAVPSSDKKNYDANMACHERYADGRDKLGGYEGGWNADPAAVKNTGARWPANLIHDGSDEVVGLFPNTKSGTISPHHQRTTDGGNGNTHGKMAGVLGASFGDSGSAARFFYAAKCSKKDRDEGCDGMEAKATAFGNQAQAEMKRGNLEHADGKSGMNKVQMRHNTHPTVKPTDLMRYLCRLVTPPGGTVLDPFMGSGSTGKAAMLEGFRFIGIERDPDYFKIAEARIKKAFMDNCEIE